MSQPSSEPTVTVGVPKETMPGERRVAVVPESVPVLARAGVRVLVEPGAGAAAWFPDDAYKRAGAKVASRDHVVGGAGVLAGVGTPAPDLIARLRAGQAVIGMLRPLAQPELGPAGWPGLG
jgi:NAD(P) transhydrogenase subunit alpha